MSRNRNRAGEITYLNSHRDNRAWEVIKTLVSGGIDTSRLLELYYWSLEPGVVELTRMYLEMPERARRTLSNYLNTAELQSIIASTDASGRLILSQPNEIPNGRPEKKRQSSPA